MSADVSETRKGNNSSSVIKVKRESASLVSVPGNSSSRQIVALSGNIKTVQTQSPTPPERSADSKKMKTSSTNSNTKSARQTQHAPKLNAITTTSCSPKPTSTSPSSSSSPSQAATSESGPKTVPVECNKNFTPSTTIMTLLVKSDEETGGEQQQAGNTPSHMSTYSSDNDCQRAFNQAQEINRNTNISLTGRGFDEQSQSNQTISRYRPQKYCAVCGDKAIACNFNAVTCESCKAFFRRNAFKEQSLKCLFERRCVIDKVTRRFCSKCRLLKCFQIGMKREWILTDEQKQIKRVKIMQNKQSKQHQHVTTSCYVSNSISSNDSPSVGSNRSTSIDSPTVTQSFRDQPSVDNTEDTPVDHQESVRVNDMKRRLSSQSIDDNYQAQPQMRDASTSCPDESDLLSGHMIHYCSMAYSCQYCSLRLTPGVEQRLHHVTGEQSQHASYLHPYEYQERQQHPHYHQQQPQHQQLQQQHFYTHQQHQQHLHISHNYQPNSQASTGQAQVPSSSGSQLSQHQMAAAAPVSSAHSVMHPNASYISVIPVTHEQVSAGAGAGHQMSMIQANCQPGQASRVATSQAQNCCCESTTDALGGHESSIDRSSQQAHLGQLPQFHMMEPSKMQREAAQTSAKIPQALSCCDTSNTNFQQQQHQQLLHQQANSSPGAAYRKKQDAAQLSLTPFVVSLEAQRASLDAQVPSQVATSGGGASSALSQAMMPASQSSSQVECRWETNLAEHEHGNEISSPGVEDATSTSVEETPLRAPIVEQALELAPSTSANEQAQQQRQPNQNEPVSVAKPSSELATLASHNSALDKANYFMWKGEPYLSPACSQDEMRLRIENIDFSETERHIVNEMIDATRLMFDPSNVDRSFNETSLDDFVYFCDSALRCLIKTVKQINAFRILGMDDQIMLLKTACFKILLLRSCLHYNEDIEGWRDKHGRIMPLSLLKNAKSLVYEKHKDVLSILACPLRNDRIIMGFMSLVLLFDPVTNIKHSNSVGLDNLIYLCILRKYLIGTQPNPLEKYERLVEATRRVNVCNEEYNVFFSKNFQPEQITPLLIEIFDISINNSV